MRLLFSLILLLEPISSAYSQISYEQEFHLLLEEIEILRSYGQVDSSMLDSARYYAGKGEHELAVIFLEDALSRTVFRESTKNENAPENQVDREPYVQSSRYNIYFKTGVDFNRQEFEVDFVEDDSVLIDEVQKPFVGFQTWYNLSGTAPAEGLKIGGGMQYDKENLRGDLDLEYNRTANLFDTRNQAGIRYDNNALYGDLSYLEFYGNTNMRWTFRDKWDLRFGNRLRLKRYRNPSGTIPDFFKDVASLEILYREPLRYFSTGYDLNYNESLSYESNDYLEQTGYLRLNGYLGGSFRNDVKIGYRNNQFSLALIGDSALTNRSQTVYSELYFRVHLNSFLSLESDYALDYKWYSGKTEQDPDYIRHRLRSGIVTEVTSRWLIKPAIMFENKTHRLQPGLVDAYIEEQNYRGTGLSLGVDYSDRSGILFSAQASYIRRRYPQADAESALTLYSNRNILNFFLFLQAPLMEKVYLNILGSYDNDRDRDSDKNDIRSSFFTAELQYNL